MASLKPQAMTERGLAPREGSHARSEYPRHARHAELRHGFGVHAFQSLVPPQLRRRWLGHASLKTRPSMAT
jgi:hypothetical protein